MQALLVLEKFDNADVINRLKIDLVSLGFKIFIIESFSELESIKPKLDLDSPCLFYRNSFIRLENPQILWDFHNKNRFKCLCIKDEIISFLPKFVELKNNNVHMTYIAIEKFDISNFKITYDLPTQNYNYTPQNINPVGLMIIENSSKHYLNRTLTSLVNSIITPFKIHLFLNQTSEDVTKTVLDFNKKHDFFEVVYIKKQAFLSTLNLAIQWIANKKFIIINNSFLFPDNTKKLFPNWAHQFTARLKQFGVVSWGTNKKDIDSGWNYNSLKSLPCFGINLDLWIKNMDSIYFNAPEKNIILSSQLNCSPNLSGILLNDEKQDTEIIPPLENKLESLTSNRSEIFNLRGIYK